MNLDKENFFLSATKKDLFPKKDDSIDEILDFLMRKQSKITDKNFFFKKKKNIFTKLKDFLFYWFDSH